MKRNVFFLLVVPMAFLSFKAFENRGYQKSIFNGELNGIPYILIDKSDYELSIYDDDGWYATYPVVFGSKDLSDKMLEGDRRTPEGTYRIVTKRPHMKWDKILLIDYPNKADLDKFNQRKAMGVLPAGAKIGGGIGIHGTWPREEMVVDQFQNWTNGCISMRNPEIEEVYRLLPVGTKVVIRR